MSSQTSKEIDDIFAVIDRLQARARDAKKARKDAMRYYDQDAVKLHEGNVQVYERVVMELTRIVRNITDAEGKDK